MGHIYMLRVTTKRTSRGNDAVTSTINDQRFVMVGTFTTMENHRFEG